VRRHSKATNAHYKSSGWEMQRSLRSKRTNVQPGGWGSHRQALRNDRLPWWKELQTHVQI
jgi:hypothetical protein